MCFRTRRFRIGDAAPLALAAVLSLASVPLHAGEADNRNAPDDATDATATTGAIDAAPAADAEPFPARALVRALIEKEVATTRLPADIAEAVVFVESRYDSTVVGRVGEIGLMQVRPETAAMLGFKGTTAELAKPEINIHYGVTYLAKAWRLAQGDLCKALMKYRAGHGEEEMTARSVIYCNRAQSPDRDEFPIRRARRRGRCGTSFRSRKRSSNRESAAGRISGTSRAADRCLCHLPARHDRGEPRVLVRAGGPRPRHQRPDRSEMAARGITMSGHAAHGRPVDGCGQRHG